MSVWPFLSRMAAQGDMALTDQITFPLASYSFTLFMSICAMRNVPSLVYRQCLNIPWVPVAAVGMMSSFTMELSFLFNITAFAGTELNIRKTLSLPSG